MSLPILYWDFVTTVKHLYTNTQAHAQQRRQTQREKKNCFFFSSFKFRGDKRTLIFKPNFKFSNVIGSVSKFSHRQMDL